MAETKPEEVVEKIHVPSSVSSAAASQKRKRKKPKKEKLFENNPACACTDAGFHREYAENVFEINEVFENNPARACTDAASQRECAENEASAPSKFENQPVESTADAKYSLARVLLESGSLSAEGRRVFQSPEKAKSADTVPDNVSDIQSPFDGRPSQGACSKKQLLEELQCLFGEVDKLERRAHVPPNEISERNAWATKAKEDSLNLAARLHDLAENALDAAAASTCSMDVCNEAHIAVQAFAKCHKLSEIVLETWSVEQSFTVCKESELASYSGKAQVLDKSLVSSVSRAAEELNAGSISCPEGYCLVYSANVKAYFLLYRSDKRDECFKLFNMEEAPTSSISKWIQALEEKVAAYSQPQEAKLERRAFKLLLLVELRSGSCKHLEAYLQRLVERSEREQRSQEFLALAENPEQGKIDQMIQRTLKNIKWELDSINDILTYKLHTNLRREQDGFQDLLKFSQDMEEDGSVLDDIELHNFAEKLLVYLRDPSGEKRTQELER